MVSKKDNKQQKFQEAVAQARKPVEPAMEDAEELQEGREMGPSRKPRRKNNPGAPFVSKRG